NIADRLPSGPAAHLRWALRVAEACAREVRYEAQLISRALRGVDTELVLLKGAAYVLGTHAAGGGRFFQDTDILVREQSLPQVEIALLHAGWVPESRDAYDQRYYREWMHEIPPLRHAQRGTLLDVHYNILPRIGRLKPDARRLIESSRPVDGGFGLRMLAPEDLILHSAAHLFQNGEFEHALRDLSDLHLLVGEHLSDDEAWLALVNRAQELDLVLPLHCALVVLARMLGVTVPQVAWHQLRVQGGGGRARRLALLFRVAMTPAPRGWLGNQVGALARAVLFMRSHWVRMPPVRLARHLLRKTSRRASGQTGSSQTMGAGNRGHGA
ncbi:MAG: nucleotidyltransferase family protein, partial [Spiribacter salinus]